MKLRGRIRGEIAEERLSRECGKEEEEKANRRFAAFRRNKQDPWVVSCHYESSDSLGGNVSIVGNFSDGSKQVLVTFFSDEHHWNLDEFLFYTMEEVNRKVRRTYVHYFRGS